MRIAWHASAATIALLLMGGVVLAQNQPGTTPPRTNGAAARPDTTPPVSREEVTESESTVITTVVDENWDIYGPIRLRSADPEDLGEIEWKNIVHWGTSSDGSDDDVEIEQEIEWGFAPNHELSLGVPIELGDGGVDGNADLSIGWHWRLWKEDPGCSWLPAFAIRNILRVPSGYHSSGVDWTLKGLITKSIVPDKFRLHVNPFLTSANGDNLESNEGEEGTDVVSRAAGLSEGRRPHHRHFQWGVITGVDYRLNECMNLIADYVHETSEMKGERNQHSAEFGLDWQISQHQKLGLVARVGLDGDDVGENFGMGISYILNFDVGSIVKCE